MYEKFEKLCEQKGVTPYKVSKETGVSTATLTNWKQGKYTPKNDKMQKIADYFDVSVDYLTGKEERVAQELSAFFGFPSFNIFSGENSLSENVEEVAEQKTKTFTSALFQDDVLIDLEKELNYEFNKSSYVGQSCFFDAICSPHEKIIFQQCDNNLKKFHNYYKYIHELTLIRGYEQRIALFKKEIKTLQERIVQYNLGNITPFAEYPNITYEDIRKYASKYSNGDLSDMEVAKIIADIRNDGNNISNLVPFPQYPSVTNKDIDEFAARNAKKKFSREEIAEMLYEMKKED